MHVPAHATSGSHPAPRVGMQVGDRMLRAMPVHLDGHRASLQLEECLTQSPLLPEGRGQLHLGWADGRVTELSVEIHSVDVPAQVAHLDIHGVKGDWRPFMEYLAISAS
jgi:hypothetical protein